MEYTENTATIAKVSYQVKLAGLTFTKIDDDYRLPRGTSSHALRRPEQKGEKAIISALRVKLGTDDLNIHPYALWPRRYADNGKRLPAATIRENYRSQKSNSPCKNDKAA